MDGSDALPAHEPARQLGLRVISPDRPGIGASSPSPGRSALDWVDDVTALVDALGIGELAVLGWSLGSVYAMACAHRLSPRVRRLAVIAGCVPLTDALALAELNALDRVIARAATLAPTVMRECLPQLGRVALHVPGFVYGALARVVDGDATLLRRALPAGLAPGLVDDYRVLVSPWGFALESITVGVDVWHGQRDSLAPAAWGEQLARRLPRAELHLLVEEGHFLALTHSRRILARLAPHG